MFIVLSISDRIYIVNHMSLMKSYKINSDIIIGGIVSKNIFLKGVS